MKIWPVLPRIPERKQQSSPFAAIRHSDRPAAATAKFSAGSRRRWNVWPRRAGGAGLCRRRSLRLVPGRAKACRRAPRQPGRDVAAQRHRPGARSAGREHRTLCPRPAGEQCAALGRARHGQIVAGQGGPCVDRRRASGRGTEAHRNPSRGHRIAARADGTSARRAAALHRVLRRSVVRRRGHLLQIAQDHARRRHRRPAGERHLLRHLEPPPSDGARHDGERARDRDQSRRGGRGEGVAVGPFWTVARLPPLQPGRISRHGRRLCRPLPRARSTPRSCAAKRSNGRRRAARAQAAWRGNTCRIWRAGSA